MITISDETFSLLFVESINPRHINQLAEIRKILHHIVKENKHQEICQFCNEVHDPRIACRAYVTEARRLFSVPSRNPLVWLWQNIKWAYFDIKLEGMK